MANVKISELPLGTPNPNSTFPFVDNGTTYQANISAITSFDSLTIGGPNYSGDSILNIHQPSDTPWAFFLYNDTYNSSSPALGGFVWNNGDVAIGTEENTQFEIYTNANYENPIVTFSGTNLNVNGDVKINGNLIITGTSIVSDVGVYRALLTQTGSLTGTSLNDFNYGLIIGETYQITNYQPGDDFSNIANVISGIINETGCVFVATGEIPTIYSNGSELVSDGGLVVNLLENTLGFPISWTWNPIGGTGYYIATNDIFGPVENSFPRKKIDVKTQLTNISFYSGSPYISISVTPYSFTAKDNIIVLNTYDLNIDDDADNALYYTPVEIKLNKDNSPVISTGTIIDSFPFINASVRILCEDILVSTYDTNNIDPISNISDLIDRLNSETGTNLLGVFTDDGVGGLQLTMTTDVKNYFCEDRTLTFEVFQN